MIRFRLAALLLLGKWLLIAAFGGLLAYAMWVVNLNLARLAIALLGLAMLIALAQWYIASRARCPLCIGFPLAHNACVTHRDTRRLFGSYRLSVAMSVVFLGRFRCPYCGESTAIEVRHRRHPKGG